MVVVVSTFLGRAIYVLSLTPYYSNQLAYYMRANRAPPSPMRLAMELSNSQIFCLNSNHPAIYSLYIKDKVPPSGQTGLSYHPLTLRGENWSLLINKGFTLRAPSAPCSKFRRVKFLLAPPHMYIVYNEPLIQIFVSNWYHALRLITR